MQSIERCFEKENGWYYLKERPYTLWYKKMNGKTIILCNSPHSILVVDEDILLKEEFDNDNIIYDNLIFDDYIKGPPYKINKDIKWDLKKWLSKKQIEEIFLMIEYNL